MFIRVVELRLGTGRYSLIHQSHRLNRLSLSDANLLIVRTMRVRDGRLPGHDAQQLGESFHMLECTKRRADIVTEVIERLTGIRPCFETWQDA